jgi:hypothetical protein
VRRLRETGNAFSGIPERERDLSVISTDVFIICFTVYACLTFISAAIPPRNNQPFYMLYMFYMVKEVGVRN